MNKEWSDLNKSMQKQIKRKDSYDMGIKILFNLRDQLMQVLMDLKDELRRNEFDAIPFVNAKGYHSKTAAYSIWHIARIEDINIHSVIKKDEQIFFLKDYQKRINSPIITTGNELVKQQIADFSKQLCLDELYSYIIEVKSSTEEIIKDLTYEDMSRKFDDDTKDYLRSLNVISRDESAAWLIDYWCDKDIRKLIQMPFSRHWIMHTEAILRIKNKIRK